MPRKRGQGEGSVFKRKDGLWVAQVTIQGNHVTKYHKTQREARDWLQLTLSQVQKGMSFTAARTTLKEYLEEWLITFKSSVRPKTITQYSQIVRQHIIPNLGKIKLKDLRPDQIQLLYNAKLKAGVSTRTVLLIHAVLHRSLEMALKWGLIGRNPVDVVSRPKYRHQEMRTLTDDQVRTFLSYTKGTRFEALFWIAISTGMRQGEILGLKWSDLDWLERKLHIQRQVQRLPGEGLVFAETKSAASRRVVGLSTMTIESLKRHWDHQQNLRILAGEKWVENDLIFPSTRGTPLDHKNLDRIFKSFLEKAGIQKIRFHDLRHTAATLMLQEGVHPKVVQERLGHSDISLTLNIYSHVLPSMQEEAAEKLDAIMYPIDISQQLKENRPARPRRDFDDN